MKEKRSLKKYGTKKKEKRTRNNQTAFNKKERFKKKHPYLKYYQSIIDTDFEINNFNAVFTKNN